MSEHELEPLSPEVAQLIADDVGPTMPEASRARLRRRVALSLALAAPVVSSAAAAQALTATGAAVAKGAATSLARKAAMLAVGSFLVGGVVGAGLHATLTERPHPAPAAPSYGVWRPSPAPDGRLAEEPAAPPAMAPSAPQEPASKPAERRASASPARSVSKDELLAEERAMVEMARTALFRGDAPAALRVVQSHAQRFARGRMAEERDSLWIQTLMQLGRADEARERARKFRATYPQSLLLPVVQRVLESNSVTEPAPSPETSADAPPTTGDAR